MTCSSPLWEEGINYPITKRIYGQLGNPLEVFSAEEEKKRERGGGGLLCISDKFQVLHTDAPTEMSRVHKVTWENIVI